MRRERLEKLAESFLRSIGAVMRGTAAVFRKELSRYDVTWPQFHLLKQVDGREGVQVTEVSSMLMIAPPTASRMIDSLCSKGLLSKEKDGRDHRITHVRLTKDGEALLERMRGAQRRLMVEVLKGEDEEEIAGVLDRMESIADKWCAMSEQKARDE